MDDKMSIRTGSRRSRKSMDVQYIPLSKDGRHHTTIGVQTGGDEFELPSIADDRGNVEEVQRPASVQTYQEQYEPYGNANGYSEDYWTEDPWCPEAWSGPGQGYNDYYQKMMAYRNVNQYATPRVYIPPSNPNKMYIEPGPPVFRAGRLGAPWRHIRQCTGNLGNHICFVDGVVKQDDMMKYPPFGYTSPEQSYPNLYPRVVPMKKSAPPPDNNRVRGRFHEHARKGFKYWQDDKRPTQPAEWPIERWGEGSPVPEMFVPHGPVSQAPLPQGKGTEEAVENMEPCGYVPVVHWMPTWRPAQARPPSPRRRQHTPHPRARSTDAFSPSPPSERPSSPRRPASRAGPRPLGSVPATPIHTVRSAPSKKSKKSGRASVLSMNQN